jgi:hypothetical protein
LSAGAVVIDRSTVKGWRFWKYHNSEGKLVVVRHFDKLSAGKFRASVGGVVGEKTIEKKDSSLRSE